MRNALFLSLFSFFTATGYSQLDSLVVDPNYLEDQLYFAATYNAFSNIPKGFSQDGFAYGFSGGFIKDIPFNKQRNFGIALGIGYSYNTYIQNIVVQQNNVEVGVDASTYDNTYNFKTNSLEFPLEVRWRSSTLEKYKFWRVYTGINFSYVLSSLSFGEFDPQIVAVSNAIEIEKFQYALSLAAGYGTWNIYANYSLTPFFKENTKLSSGENLDMSSFRIGLIFYFF
tara:strand:- start:72534 stop:73214 length:681 start_codon:yes stop_codon:yes gene_type:complete